MQKFFNDARSIILGLLLGSSIISLGALMVIGFLFHATPPHSLWEFFIVSLVLFITSLVFTETVNMVFSMRTKWAEFWISLACFGWLMYLVGLYIVQQPPTFWDFGLLYIALGSVAVLCLFISWMVVLKEWNSEPPKHQSKQTRQRQDDSYHRGNVPTSASRSKRLAQNLSKKPPTDDVLFLWDKQRQSWSQRYNASRASIPFEEWVIKEQEKAIEAGRRKSLDGWLLAYIREQQILESQYTEEDY